MADPLLDPLNATTLKTIYPDAVEDLLFLDAPFLAYIRGSKAFRPFTGGVMDQNVFLYRSLLGGRYTPGTNFSLVKQQTVGATQFTPRYYQTTIVEYKETLQVINKGPAAVFKLVDIDMQNAIQTISAMVAVDLGLNGQTGARSGEAINGWTEAINPGDVPSWDGNIYTTYGDQARNGAISNKLNGNVYWCGNPDGTTAPITYTALVEMYMQATRGRETPNLGVMNKAVMAYVLEKIQTQQRFEQIQDPYFGQRAFKLQDASMLVDEYFPSKRYGQNDPILGNWLTGTIAYTAPATFTAQAVNFPTTNVTLTVGEVIAFYNMRKWLFKLSDDPEFGFGWSGFVPAQDNTRVAGQVKAALNLECLAPWANVQGYGIGG